MRRVRALAQSRGNNEQFARWLKANSPEDWPKFLNCAWAIAFERLAESETAGESAAGAIVISRPSEIVISAVAAAHDCARAVSARAQANEQARVRDEFLSAIEEVIKPVERSKRIQRALDEVAQREFRDADVDLEAVSRFFDGCADVARKKSSLDAARRILNALAGRKHETDARSPEQAPLTLKIATHYEAIHPSDRAMVEAGLLESIGRQSEPLTALGVFAAMIHSLSLAEGRELNARAGDLLTQYVAAVAEIWDCSGLGWGRGTGPDNPKYRGPFHRFLELVLIDQFDPRSRLFDPPDEKELSPGREDYDRLPDDLRAETRLGPQYQWLISEDYIRKVRHADKKAKNDGQTP